MILIFLLRCSFKVFWSDLFQLIDDFSPDTYNYLLGHSILVAPITSNPAEVSVTFPASKDMPNDTTQWIYWFNHTRTYNEKQMVTFSEVPLEEFTVFAKAC